MTTFVVLYFLYLLAGMVFMCAMYLHRSSLAMIEDLGEMQEHDWYLIVSSIQMWPLIFAYFLYAEYVQGTEVIKK